MKTVTDALSEQFAFRDLLEKCLSHDVISPVLTADIIEKVASRLESDYSSEAISMVLEENELAELYWSDVALDVLEQKYQLETLIRKKLEMDTGVQIDHEHSPC